MSKMKNVITWALCLSLLVPVFMLTSCEKEPKPEIKLTAKTPTENTISFAVSPENAVKAAYLYTVKGEATPDAATILSTGTAVDATKTTEHTVENLLPETTYVVYAAAEGAGQTVVAEPVEITTLEQGEKRIVFDNVLEATYITNEGKGFGNYFLTLSNAQPNAEDGKPVNVGDMIVTLDLYNAIDKDPLNALLPAGLYEPKNDFSPFSWYALYTAAQIRVEEGNGENAIVSMPAIAGTVDVAYEKGAYTIKIDLKLMNDVEISAIYTGAVNFVQTQTDSYKRFTEPQNVAFEIGQGRYFGNWYMPHADDVTIEFFNGKFDENNQLSDGYMLYIPLYMPKLEDYTVSNPPLVEGTYQILKNNRDNYTYIPFTMEPGAEVEVMGQMYFNGVYLLKLDSKTNSREVGFMKSGTMEVKVTGDEYTIAFDFITEENISVKGSYTGKMNIVNRCDNDTNPNNPKRPWSKLEDNHSLVFPQQVTADAYFMGTYLYPDYNSWMVNISDPSEQNPQGDMITVEFLTPKAKGFVLEEGTYTISKTAGEYVMFPGTQSYGSGQILYSWYGDLSSVDSEGYATVLAPLNSGTMVVTKVGDEYKFVFDFKDDADNAITGEWTGAVKTYDFSAEMNKSNAPVKTLKRR